MAAKKTTVTHADGTVSKRTSQTRSYTHAVEVGPATAEAAAAGKTRRAEWHEDAAARLSVAANRGRVVITDRRLGGTDPDELYSHQAVLVGTKSAKGNESVYTWCSADGRTRDYRDSEPIVTPVADYLVESARSSAAHHEKEAAKLRTEAADILAAGKPYGTYSVVRWSSRRDLAEKALSEYAYLTEQGYPVRVVAVDAL